MHFAREAGAACRTGLFLLSCILPGFLAGSPLLPGVERLAESPDADPALLGEILIAELSCTSCHRSDSPRLRLAGAPDLARVGSRATPGYLKRFVAAPHEARAGSPMPDLFHAVPGAERDTALENLTHFLVSLGGPMPGPVAGGTRKELEWGKELFHSVGCVACHGPQEGTPSEGYTAFGDLAAKTTIDALAAFLVDPHRVRPAGRMPSLWLDEEDARAISVYLLRGQLDNPGVKDALPVSVPGLNVDYYEVSDIHALPDFTRLEPVGKGTVDSVGLRLPFDRRSNNYALRFHGEIRLEEGGRFQFATVSDDGSRLIIDRTTVVDNDGDHGMQRRQGEIELEAGTHFFEVQYYNAGGPEGLNLTWRRMDGERRHRPVPTAVLYRSGGLPMAPADHTGFRIDPDRVLAGRREFRQRGCASCHQLEEHPSLSTAPALVLLDPDSDEGCLSGDVRAGLPFYRLDERQRGWIRAALGGRDELGDPRVAAESVPQALAAHNCYACHDRDGIGGPAEALENEYFHSYGEIDLGDEGRIPPSLDHAGAKLRTEALERILVSRDLHVRDYMKVRMPRFGLEDPAALADRFAEADRETTEASEWTFRESDVAVGRQLVGSRRGLACITCHNIAGQKSLAVPGIDMATAYDRLERQWFEQFLARPARYIPGTRMPQFWPGGFSPFQDIHGGDALRQIQSIWSYLSLGKSVQLPEGIVPDTGARMEIVPLEAPVVHRTFMQDVGPRAILAGYPERISVAFDANVVRLAKVWRGRFFDHSGVESGRTDNFLGPLGEDVLDMPAGPAIARLETPESPWPRAELTTRDLGGDFLGYRLDPEGRPVFRYRLGDLVIRETPVPVLRPGGGTLRRTFRLQGESSGDLHLLAARGTDIGESDSDLSYRVDDRVRIRLEGSPAPRPILRSVPGESELILPVRLQDGQAEIHLWIEW